MNRTFCVCIDIYSILFRDIRKCRISQNSSPKPDNAAANDDVITNLRFSSID